MCRELSKHETALVAAQLRRQAYHLATAPARRSAAQATLRRPAHRCSADTVGKALVMSGTSNGAGPSVGGGCDPCLAWRSIFQRSRQRSACWGMGWAATSDAGAAVGLQPGWPGL